MCSKNPPHSFTAIYITKYYEQLFLWDARSDDIIQIIGLPTDSYLTPASLIIDSDKLEQAATKLEEHPAEIHFITKKLKIIVNENNGEITIQNIDSEILFQEGARRIVHDVVLDENVNHIQQSFKWADDEAL